MSRIVPSQIVAFIKQEFPRPGERGAPHRPPATSAEIEIEKTYTIANLSGITRLIRELPPELIRLGGDDYADLVSASAVVADIVDHWRSTGKFMKVDYTYFVNLIRDSLAKCADEAPSPTTTGLEFIADDRLRESIRLDISAANQNFMNGEWKGATVLAGAAIEALLFWAIEQKPAAELNDAIDAAIAARNLRQRPRGTPSDWGLHVYIELAFKLQLITENTPKQAQLAREFRNLIHPGRAAFLTQACDRGTTLSALAAVEHVARDLA